MRRLHSRKVTTFANLVLAIGLGAASANAQKMYWPEVSAGKIQRADLDGSNMEQLIGGLGGVYRIALDPAGGKIYWPDGGAGKIQRANLDGSGVVEDLITGLSWSVGIALDPPGGKMYWTNSDGEIQRADLGGSNLEVLVTGLDEPHDIDLDVGGGKMYWTAPGASKIQRANLDGSGVVEDLLTGLGVPIGIGLDQAGGKMYWTNAVGEIHRADLDGANPESLVTGLSEPWDIALDAAGGKMYWPDPETGKIQRANLDGSGVVQDLVTGLGSPAGIALDLSASPGAVPVPAVSAWGMIAIALLLLSTGALIICRRWNTHSRVC